MRFQLTFHRSGKQKMLPMDYQYYISAWIYKVLKNADPGFADFLHTEGYAEGPRHFKLFNYSPLDFGRPKLWKEKSLFEINSHEAFLQVSFQLNDAAEKFIVGLFNRQTVYVGNRFNGIDYSVVQIERLPDPVFSGEVRYRALSPIVISQRNENEKHPRYLSPDDKPYKELLRQHLIHKYNSIPGVQKNQNIDIHFELLNKPKSKLITIKPYTRQQSKIRGFLFDFVLKAPPEIQQMIYAVGIGEKNSTGFGWVEKINQT